MKDRLDRLKNKMGVQWRELAQELEISVPMLGCLRRGERNPSPNLLARLADLEAHGKKRVALHSVATDAAKSIERPKPDIHRALADATEVVQGAFALGADSAGRIQSACTSGALAVRSNVDQVVRSWSARECVRILARVFRDDLHLDVPEPFNAQAENPKGTHS